MSDLSLAPMIFAYNGWEASVHASVDVDARPIWTTDGRGVRAVKYVFTVKDVIYDVDQDQGDSADAAVAELRERLMKPAGELVAHDLGFGEGLIVNTPPDGPTVGPGGTRKDVLWGPKPVSLRLETHGGMAVSMTFVLEVAVGECPDVPREHGLLEWSTSITWQVGKGGYQTRVVEGNCMIAQTRETVDSTTLTDNADRLREAVVAGIPQIPGFRRSYGPWKLSPDKCRIDWSVIDAEWADGNDSYPPPGVVEVSADQTANTGNGFGSRSSSTLRATYEVARSTPKSAAFAAFLNLFRLRSQASRETPAPGGAPNVPLVRSFAASENEIYGKGEGSKAASFAITWTFLADLSSLLLATGLFRRVSGGAGGDWQRWAVSLADTAFHHRGNAKLGFQNEAVLDLCHQGTYRLNTGGGGRPRGGIDRGGDNPAGSLRNETPHPYVSWMDFVSSIRLEQIDETHVLKTLPLSPPRILKTRLTPPSNDDRLLRSTSLADVLAGGGKPLPDVAVKASAIDPVAAYGKGGGDDDDVVIQVAARPTHVVILRGYAVRAGHPINPPQVVSVGGAAAIPQNREGYGFEQWIGDAWFGVPIYLCRWNFRYVLDGPPTQGLPFMSTPALGVREGGG